MSPASDMLLWYKIIDYVLYFQNILNHELKIEAFIFNIQNQYHMYGTRYTLAGVRII
jgi:hypothetical protein